MGTCGKARNMTCSSVMPMSSAKDCPAPAAFSAQPMSAARTFSISDAKPTFCSSVLREDC